MDKNNGSYWRKWDFHVHTPESSLNNGFGSDWEEYIYHLFTRAIKNSIAAIGITDYFLIEGYKKVISIRDNEDYMKTIFYKELEADDDYLNKIRKIFLFPNIELRLEHTIKKDGKDSKLQIHVLFSNEINLDYLENEFLGSLKLKYLSSPSGESQVSLNKKNIERIGENLKKNQHEGFGSMTDIEAGLNAAYVNFDQLQMTLKNEIFKDKYFVIGVEEDVDSIKWNNQAHLIRKNYYSFCNGFFSSNSRKIKWGLLESTIKEFGSIKSCLWGSDSHNYESMFVPNLNRHCWIKADTTFSGLIQCFITPEDRIFIGEIPPALQSRNNRLNKTISNIEVKSTKVKKNPQQKWFDTEMNLSPFMTTIIGNKGSGKSALSDIIAYTANSKSIEDASFLSTDRFLKKDRNYGNDYYSTITWLDKSETKNTKETLSQKILDDSIELVKFLPQRYIERVCTDLSEEFQNEVNKVIFSYISLTEKSGYFTLDEVLESKTSKYNDEIQQIRGAINTLNSEIKSLESKKRKNYLQEVHNKLLQKIKELNDLENDIPKTVDEPGNFNESDEIKIISEIDTLISTNEDEIKLIAENITAINKKLQEINQFYNKFKLLSDNIEDFNSTFSKLLVNLDLDIPLKQLEYKFNINIIDEEYKKLLENKRKLMIKIENEIQFLESSNLSDNFEINSINIQNEINKLPSLYDKIKLLKDIKSSLVSKVDNQSRLYQNYLDEVSKWKKKKQLLTGEIENNESIEFYQTEVDYVKKTLDNDISVKYNDRLCKIGLIYDVFIRIKKDYIELYNPIQKRLENLFKVINEKIEFDVSLRLDTDFIKKILDFIDRRAKGPYQGINEGYNKLEQYLINAKIDDRDSFLNLIDSIMKSATNNIDDMTLFLGDSRDSFFDYISQVRYLKNNYIMKLQGRELKELSPGERGIVLLIFYLTLDTNDIPIIIDQPEDNLDNQSIFSKLVPCIKMAKTRRQVIIVTHNPNIAIACDSELIIYCEMNKQDSSITYVSGTIESNTIKEKAVSILEGTLPAFTLRKEKYRI